MKITLGTAFGILGPIRTLAALPLPIKVGYWIGRRCVAVEKRAKEYDEQRAKLAGEHGATPTEVVPEDRRAAFVAIVTEMADIEVDLPDWFAPIKLSDIPEKCKVAGDVLMALEEAGVLTE